MEWDLSIDSQRDLLKRERLYTQRLQIHPSSSSVAKGPILWISFYPNPSMASCNKYTLSPEKTMVKSVNHACIYVQQQDGAEKTIYDQIHVGTNSIVTCSCLPQFIMCSILSFFGTSSIIINQFLLLLFLFHTLSLALLDFSVPQMSQKFLSRISRIGFMETLMLFFILKYPGSTASV